MRKATVSILVATILLLALGAASAAATAPLDVVIVATLGLESNEGTFTASGPAVEAGLFCSAGTFENLSFMDTGWQSWWHAARPGLNFHADNKLTCAGGTIVLQVNGRTDWRTNWETPVGSWVVKKGTGDYASLHGAGEIYGVQISNGFEDHYTGQLN